MKVPDNSVLEVLEASLENGSRIVLKKVESLMVLQKPLSDDLEANFLKKQFFNDYLNYVDTSYEHMFSNSVSM